MSSVNTARLRTLLFVPASRIDRVPKAIATGADGVIVDLEDAVEVAAKAGARRQLSDFLTQDPTTSVLVRINGAETEWFTDDLDFCSRHANIAGIVLPKTETIAELDAVAAVKPVWPIIETAKGLLALPELTRGRAVVRLMLGTLDLGVDLQLTPDSPGANTVLDQARYQLLVHCRAAGLLPPLDGTHPQIQDVEGLRRHVARARDMGFAGVGCIHPSQVPVVHEIFAPGPAEIDWAQRILAEADKTGLGAFRLDGAMVDAPVIARARAILSRAQAND